MRTYLLLFIKHNDAGRIKKLRSTPPNKWKNFSFLHRLRRWDDSGRSIFIKLFVAYIRLLCELVWRTMCCWNGRGGEASRFEKKVLIRVHKSTGKVLLLLFVPFGNRKKGRRKIDGGREGDEVEKNRKTRQFLWAAIDCDLYQSFLRNEIDVQ